MAEEKKETIRQRLEKIYENDREKIKFARSVRLTSNNVRDIDLKICEKCGSKWCLKRWEMTIYRNDKVFSVGQLYEYPDELVLRLLSRSSGNPHSSIENAQKNIRYDPNIAKNVHEFSTRNYCYKHTDRVGNYSILKFKLDDKISYLLSTDKTNILMISENYVYTLSSRIKRLPLNTYIHDSALENDASFLYYMIDGIGEKISYEVQRFR